MADKFNLNDEVVNVYTGERGIVLGKKDVGGSIRWQIFISQQSKPWIKEDQLKKVDDEKDLVDRFYDGEFLGLQELKRILSFIRIKGDVTNIYYSMNNGATRFFPYQFKPVLKFIESSTGRLLVADEVGLGKTIEAMYIWQELVARENSRRLIIVCPSMLCEKWKKDMFNFFSIDAKIVDAGGLHQELEDASNIPAQKHFALITSLEGIRYKEKEEAAVKKSSKVRLYEFLKSRHEKNEFPIIDMVVVDEAHILRNSGTASHKTVSLIRDNSNKVILLSATPIQTHESNLFNVLSILDPEVFFDKKTFEYQLEEGQNYIVASNLLRGKTSADKILPILAKIKKGPMYAQDPSFIDNFENRLGEILKNDRLRLEYFDRFAQKVFYANYFTRTRKRDALDSPLRCAYTYSYDLNAYEKGIYEKTSDALRELSCQVDKFGAFQIIARQRQMASCLYAAFESWMNKVEFSKDDEEICETEDVEGYSEVAVKHLDLSKIISDTNVNLEQLEKNDSKYNEVLKCIRNQFEEYPNSKIVLFSFYRNTISYLERRFRDDGINCISMMGGGTLDKNAIMREFREDKAVRILLSTEVGSEGLDLQFCDTEINYDLPWNPMRLEQRIGRIDRIGQNAAKLNIINLACADSVEDKVLLRLYDRIDIFKRSIGDIDEILGNATSDIALVLLDKNLSEQEREKKAEDLIQTACIKKNLQEELEDNAANFRAFQDYIIKNVDDAQKTQRYIRSIDLKFYVTDYLSEQWPDCKIEEFLSLKDALVIQLSHEAAKSFSSYLAKQGMNSQLRLSATETLCLFDSSQRNAVRRNYYEVISYSHPLVKWITEERSNIPTSSYGCSSVEYVCEKESLPESGRGMYAYYVQQWNADGFKKKNELKFYLCHVESQNVVEPLLAEELISKAFMNGASNLRWEEFCNLDDAYDALDLIKNKADSDFVQFEGDFEIGNKDFCNQQKIAVVTTAERKIAQLQEVVDNLRANGNERIAKLNEDQIVAVKKRLTDQLSDIDLKMQTQCQNAEICLGLLMLK